MPEGLVNSVEYLLNSIIRPYYGAVRRRKSVAGGSINDISRPGPMKADYRWKNIYRAIDPSRNSGPKVESARGWCACSSSPMMVVYPAETLYIKILKEGRRTGQRRVHGQTVG